LFFFSSRQVLRARPPRIRRSVGQAAFSFFSSGRSLCESQLYFLFGLSTRSAALYGPSLYQGPLRRDGAISFFVISFSRSDFSCDMMGSHLWPPSHHVVSPTNDFPLKMFPSFFLLEEYLCHQLYMFFYGNVFRAPFALPQFLSVFSHCKAGDLCTVRLCSSPYRLRLVSSSAQTAELANGIEDPLYSIPPEYLVRSPKSFCPFLIIDSRKFKKVFV